MQSVSGKKKFFFYIGKLAQFILNLVPFNPAT